MQDVKSSRLFLGVDGGGMKTIAVVSDDQGHILSAGRAGCSNYQSIGERAAGREMRAAIDTALKGCGASLGDIASAGFGIEGADREPEMAVVSQMVEQFAPVPRRFVENDALLVLRAATKDAVGVGLAAGTSTNCVGRDRYGRRLQVGGLGAVSGDVGYAEDLAMRTIGASWMASDGRTAPSSLSHSVPATLGVSRMDEIPRLLVRGVLPEVLVGKVVECLFAEAEKGDGMAARIIEDTGARLGAMAAAVMRALVLRGANAVVVLGGSMYQALGHGKLVEATSRTIQNTINEAHVIVLRVEPVVGAVLFARDLLGQAPLAFANRLRGESAGIEKLCTSQV
jgi:N-acetylglucosamine kinase-like BadF-type ATPase